MYRKLRLITTTLIRPPRYSCPNLSSRLPDSENGESKGRKRESEKNFWGLGGGRAVPAVHDSFSHILLLRALFPLLYIFFYYISTEIYSLKSHVVNFRSEISSGQSEERTTFFTCEKNRSSNQKLRTIFFHCIG